MSLPERTRKRDRFLKPFAIGRSRSASRSDTTPAASTDAGPQTTTSAPSIYDSALEKISPDDRAFFTDHDGLDECLANAKTLQKLRYGERLKWKFRGKEHSFQKAADTIVATIDQFKTAGDGVASLLPQAAIPWAVFKALLKLAVDNKKQRDFLIQGIERAIHTNHRLVVYEQELGDGKTSENMRDTLVKLNVKILEFLAIAMRTISHNRAVALIHPLWNLPRIETFDKECSELLVVLAQDAASCGRAVHLQQHQQVTHRLDEIMDHLDMQLFAGAVAEGATHRSKEQVEASRCLPQTRTDLLGLIHSWTQNDTNIFWLCGQAGTGKSTISRTVAAEVAASGHAVASFFFKRTEARRSNARLLFATIVQQLVEQVPPMRKSITQALHTHAILNDRGLNEQWQKLIEEPLANLDLKVFLIIDALDECILNDVKGVLLVLFAAQVSLKIFLTSRPEVEIVRWFQQGKHESFRLEDIKPNVSRHDIKLFIDHELKDHTNPDGIEALTEKTTPLFIAASTLCRFVLALDPDSTILEILKGQYWASDMAQFYSSILQQILLRLGSRKTEYVKRFHAIVAPLVLLSDPLNSKDLAKLLGETEASVVSTLAPLTSVLSLEGCIRPLHLTFYESAAQFHAPFAIEVDSAHDLLHKACLKILDAELKRDLLGLHHPGTRRKDVKVSLSPVLSYACENWRWHMRTTERLEWFLSTHLLHWLEAMSWLNKLTSALDDLLALTQLEVDETTLNLVQDSRQFLQRNMYIISEAPLQLYLSALAFAPKHSLVRHHYGAIVDSNPYFRRFPPSQLEWDHYRWSLPLDVRVFCFDADRARLALLSVQSELFLISADTGIVLLHHQKVAIQPYQTETCMRFSSQDKVSILHNAYHNSPIPNNFYDKSEIYDWDLLTGIVTRTRLPTPVLAVSDDFVYMVTQDEKAALQTYSAPWPGLLDRRTAQTRSLQGDHSGFSRHHVGASVNTRHAALCHSRRFAYLFDNGSASCIWRFEAERASLTATIRLSARSEVLVLPNKTQQISILRIDGLQGKSEHLQQLQHPGHDVPPDDGLLQILEILLIDSALHISWTSFRELIVAAIDTGDITSYDLISPGYQWLVEPGRLIHMSESNIACFEDLQASKGAQIEPLRGAAGTEIDTSGLLPIEQLEDLRYCCSSAGLIAICSKDRLQVYDNDLQVIMSRPVDDFIYDLRISRDETHLMYHEGNGSKTTIKVVALRSGSSQQQYHPGETPRCLDWAPNSRYITWATLNNVFCFDLQLGVVTMQQACMRVASISFTSDSRAILIRDAVWRSNNVLSDQYKLFDVQGPLLAKVDADDLSYSAITSRRSSIRDAENAAIATMQAMVQTHRLGDLQSARLPAPEPMLAVSNGWIEYDSETFFWVPPSQRRGDPSFGDFNTCTNSTVLIRKDTEWPKSAIYLTKPGFEQRLIADSKARRKNVGYQKKA